MKQTAQHLRETITAVLPLLGAISEVAATEKNSPEKWSKKEILGHLIDSASNNHHKFVRTMAEPQLNFVGYQQNHWVNAQHYQAAHWADLLVLWHALNLHLAHIIEHAAPEVLDNTISIEGVGPFKLEFIMRDYAEHLKHHLRQILPNANIESAFVNVYGA